MAKALLVYTTYDNSNSIINSTTLESGSLYYVDKVIKGFSSKEELLNSFMYNNYIDKTNDGNLKLYYIKNNSYKEELPLLINDDKPIFLDDDYLKGEISELERARKLLFKSKNKSFLRNFLENEMLSDTIMFDIKLSNKEYDFAKKRELPVFELDNDYFVHARDLFEHVLEKDKIGLLRQVFEETLEVWKKKIKNYGIDSETVYYYSRNLRILINDYYYNIKLNKKISNLSISQKLITVMLYNYNNPKVVEVVKSDNTFNKNCIKSKIKRDKIT